MKVNCVMKRDRRRFVKIAGAAGSALALVGLPLALRAASESSRKMKIGIVGSGRVGGALGGVWVKAGHEVMFSSRSIEHDKALAASLGPNARAGTPAEAAAFGEVLMISVPYRALPTSARNWGPSSRARW
ncbi:MAG: NAD(P)-binding domain-containing protein [Gammaproteobacteria bacterium]|nr:NAD(P)-binding domain-containing protein [Gammaproteobacteria bacterium]